ncbi:inositol 1,4,5-trisphosphate receptor-interacting protein-like 1 [Poecile atricapillus]|uniref:inositol 1,4,5-trisphosphate receptor-interacting protein-like 1 n=1 Tax=Poecile atricapillus TaxID=48891 RepID=UPI0027398DC5|nr:inositol 1,4,5-trisphosphate receptor-interacting protein-like 1 [Poecile atricapillus]
MNSVVFLFMLLKSLTLYPQPVGDWDEEARRRMELRAQQLEHERLLLEQEVERLIRKSETQQYLQLVTVAVLLVLVLLLWFLGWERSLRRERNEEENEEGVRNRDANGEEAVGNEEGNANREEDNNDDGNVQQVGNAAANEADHGGNGAVNEDAAARNNHEDLVREVEDVFGEINSVILMARIQWPVQDLQRGCEWITDLMDKYATFFGLVLSNSFYPVLQRAIGVGSAFEGWSPREQDVVYRVLVPMTPPRGHSFHLELDTAGHTQVRNFRVRVQLECTCTREQQGDNMLCFLHHPKEELRKNQDPSLLDTLCTGSYLDVQKTARWFYQLVRAIWPALPQSHSWHLTLLPSRRSCQFKVTDGEESFRIEMLFGVRRGDSDIFVSSQPREAHTPNTTWPETYAVAEMKFFKHIARQAPPDSLHLRCLQFFTRLQLGFCFSTYAIKTLVMHLLAETPVALWCRRHFLERLLQIRDGLFLCVRAKRLNHFIVGNERLPRDIRVPPDVPTATTHNLFHRLAQDSDAYSQAMLEYRVLREWLDESIEMNLA